MFDDFWFGVVVTIGRDLIASDWDFNRENLMFAITATPGTCCEAVVVSTSGDNACIEGTALLTGVLSVDGHQSS